MCFTRPADPRPSAVRASESASGVAVTAPARPNCGLRRGALVTLLHGRYDLRETMSQYLVDAIEWAGVAVRGRSEIAALTGEDAELEAVALTDGSVFSTSSLLLSLDARPCTAWLDDTVARDPDGFLLSGAGSTAILETSIPGVHAAGDVRAGSSERCTSAIAEGAAVAQFAHRRLAASAGGGVA